MISTIKNKLILSLFGPLRSSYSQSGEDIIISDLFKKININKPTYLDIGANEPEALSNTYRLYKKGSQGVCIEPNPRLFKKFKKKRPRDIVLNTGIAFDDRRNADYYLFKDEAHGFSTFSKEDADFWVNTGNDKVGRFKIDKIINMPLIPLQEVIETHFPGKWPNLISIDVEGLDQQILETIDLNKYKTEVICVETLVYQADNKETKNRRLINFLIENGYLIFADTYINTIFCRKECFPGL